MRIKIIYIQKIITILCVMACMACGGQKNQSLTEDVKKVKTAAVESKSLPDEIHGFGTLSYQKKFDVAASADAVLDKLYFREGEIVQKGRVIAQLANEQIDLALGRAENELANAAAALDLAKAVYIESRYAAEAQILTLEKSEAELEETEKAHNESRRKFDAQVILHTAGGVSEENIRVGRFALDSEAARLRIARSELAIRRIGYREKDLRAAGFGVPEGKTERDEAFINLATLRSKAEVRAAEARLLSAEKELQSAELAKAELTIKAPASGTVAMRYLEEGERVKKEDKLFTLMDTESLYATVPVRESDALRLKKGMDAEVTIDGTNDSFSGQVDLISPYAESQSFTFAVRILLPASVLTDDSFAKPGMFARASITAGPERSVLAIDTASIISRKADKAAVFVVNGKQIQERPVKLGEQLEEGWEVIEGLQEGELVVVRPDSALQDGEYVSLAN